MPKVSVIVPVYGVEKYIERCARSLFEQTLDDIEFIFVDDCTPDRSIEILNAIIEEYRLRFAEMNYTVRIERMPTNSGQAAVRRHGIQLATGDYIIHCDSDDWVDRNMYRLMYDEAVDNNADVVVCDYYSHDGTNIINQFAGSKNTDRLQLLKDMLFQNISWAVWNKMIKKDLYANIKHYPAGAMGEDMVLSIQLIDSSKKIIALNQPLYYYFSNEKSITHQISSDAIIRKFNQYYQNYLLIDDYLKSCSEYHELKRALNWTKYSIKSFLYSSDKIVRSKRKGLFRFVELKILFYPEVLSFRKRNTVSNIINSILCRR